MKGAIEIKEKYYKKMGGKMETKWKKMRKEQI